METILLLVGSDFCSDYAVPQTGSCQPCSGPAVMNQVTLSDYVSLSLLDVKRVNKTVQYPSSSEGDGGRPLRDSPPLSSNCVPRAMEQPSSPALQAQQFALQEAESCIFVFGQSPSCLFVGRNLAFGSWMAIKGTENICITNTLLMLSAAASTVLAGGRAAPDLAELCSTARSQPTELNALAYVFLNSWYFSPYVLSGNTRHGTCQYVTSFTRCMSS